MFTTKWLEGKTTTMSKLVAFRPTFNFRLLITACASNTFTSITSRAQLVSGCGDLLWGSSAAVCNWKVFCTRRSGDVMLFWNSWLPVSEEVRGQMLAEFESTDVCWSDKRSIVCSGGFWRFRYIKLPSDMDDSISGQRSINNMSVCQY